MKLGSGFGEFLIEQLTKSVVDIIRSTVFQMCVLFLCKRELYSSQIQWNNFRCVAISVGGWI